MTSNEENCEFYERSFIPDSMNSISKYKKNKCLSSFEVYLSISKVDNNNDEK